MLGKSSRGRRAAAGGGLKYRGRKKEEELEDK